MAVALLPRELTGALLAVEVAWGADLTALDTTWTWTDVTADVRLDPGIDVSMGRADEASTTQPATCTLTLDNTAGRYSLGPQSSNYPNVRRGTPVRVRVRPSTVAAYVVVFQGNAAGWQPDWNERGNVATVSLEAAGTLRRLGQGVSPVVSPLRRSITQANPVAYWPCEDGEQATNFAAGNSTSGRYMTWSGVPKLAESRAFRSSSALPKINAAVFYGDVPAYTPAALGTVSVRATIGWDTSPPVGSIPLRIFTSGAFARVDFTYNTGGSLSLVCYDRFDTVLYTLGPIGFNADGLELVNVTIDTSAGVLVVGINTIGVGDTSEVGFGANTAVAGTVGLVTKIVVNPTRGLVDTVIGHIAVEVGAPAVSARRNQLNAYVGEDPTTRITRLCAENAVPFTSQGFPDGSTSTVDLSGPQDIDALLGLLRTTETAAQGVLYDGVSAGLFYRTRRAREAQTAALTIDAASGQLSPPFEVVDDDQRTRNSATVSRVGGGAEFTYQDTTGPLGINTVGLYDTSAQISVQLDEAAQFYAGWLVALGTVVGYRYPQVTLDLRKVPTLAAAWLTVQPGTRIDITNIGGILPGHPVRTLSLMVEGVSNQFNKTEWTGVAKCSPFDPWRVASYAADLTSGDNAWITRVDQVASTNAAMTSATTSISITSPLPWITTATFPAELPFDLEVRGQQVTVTAITGATVTQTFTVDASRVVGTIPSGSTVQLWQPTTVGL